MRTCGCGTRGRHKPTCTEVNKIKTVVKTEGEPRPCGCGKRGRHKKECNIKSMKKESFIYNEAMDVHSLYVLGYGEPAHLSWFPNKPRQTVVERRIKSLVRRFKTFYLTTISLDKDSNKEETWYIDGGNWVSKKDSNGYNILIGHINNCLEFLAGRKPIWKRRVR